MTQSRLLAPIAITSGEPAGIGPELMARLFSATSAGDLQPYFYIGSHRQVTDLLGDSRTALVATPEEARDVFPAALPVLDMPLAVEVTPGRPDARNAASVIGAIDCGATLALSGKVRALVTNPIQKSTLREAGFSYRGHTDYLGHLAGIGQEGAVMVLDGPGLRVACVTHHIPLRKVSGALSTASIVECGTIIAKEMATRFSIPSPRIAVAGLNPHAGEVGMLGDEDAEIIGPAIEALKDLGIDASGPWPADSMFDETLRSRYDIALCMYHDQALIPIKTLFGRRAVNVTLGLPFVRTSPGHGTALDIAGTDRADIAGLAAAVTLADKLSRT